MSTSAIQFIRRKTTTIRVAAPAFRRFLFAGRALPVVALVLLSGSACGGAEDARERTGSTLEEPSNLHAPTAAAPEVLAPAFEMVRSLEMEENDEVMVVQPMVTVGAPGELLVTEPLEGQVRVYSTSGELLDNMGARGEGPGEFAMPMFTHRTLDGGLVVADAGLSRLTFFGPDGEAAEPEVATVGLGDHLGALQLDADRYLVAGYHEGSEGRGRGRFLHIWNRSTELVERSFLQLHVPEEMIPLALSLTGVVATLEADTIWALRALADTLYKFSREGDRLGAFALPAFAPAGLDDSDDGGAAGSTEAQHPFDTVVQAANVFVLGEDRIAVQFVQTQGTEMSWSLVVVDRQGNEVWSAEDTPRLFVVDQDDLFYFKDPTTVLANRWLVARLRSDL